MHRLNYAMSLVAGLVLLITAPAAHAQGADTITAGGTPFAMQADLDGRPLLANGAGVRTKFFLDIYAAALYLPAKSNDASAILAAEDAARVHIVMLRDLSADRFVSALDDGLRANLPAAQYQAIEAQRTALATAMRALGEARKGDVILLERPQRDSTRLVVNGTPRTDIDGAGFFTGLLRIWLGEQPVDAGLKEHLLGRGQR